MTNVSKLSITSEVEIREKVFCWTRVLYCCEDFNTIGDKINEGEFYSSHEDAEESFSTKILFCILIISTLSGNMTVTDIIKLYTVCQK